MNNFTKEELEYLLNCCYSGMHDDHPIEEYKLQLQVKLQSMIDNDPWNTRKIVKSHLIEAESLINHALELLKMTDE